MKAWIYIHGGNIWNEKNIKNLKKYERPFTNIHILSILGKTKVM